MITLIQTNVLLRYDLILLNLYGPGRPFPISSHPFEYIFIFQHMTDSRIFQSRVFCFPP